MQLTEIFVVNNFDRLFFGSMYAIDVSCIRILKQAQNFRSVIEAICVLDNIISGNISDKGYPSKEYAQILSKLFADTIDGHSKNQQRYDDYIHATFKCFVENKIELILDLVAMSKIGNESILNLVMESHERVHYASCPDGCNNILNKDLLKVFFNVKSIWINSALGPNYTTAYHLSLSKLISTIQQSTVEMVEIVASIEDTWYEKNKLGFSNHTKEFEMQRTIDSRKRQQIITINKL